MCIRDREMVEGYLEDDLRPDRPVVAAILDGEGDETLGHLCLLYTSDAADDLLCVDLGGRRIITKKTHNTPSSLSTAVL